MHKALHRPLTVCGVDRRLFFLALLMGGATFNLFYSFWSGVLVFVGLYGFAVGDAAIQTCCASSSRRPEAGGGTTRASTSGSTLRWCRGEVRDYSDAGGLNTLLPLWGFVDGGAFMTKAGHVGLVYRLRGVDVDGLTQAQRRSLTHRMEAALRQLDERCRLYQAFDQADG